MWKTAIVLSYFYELVWHGSLGTDRQMNDDTYTEGTNML